MISTTDDAARDRHSFLTHDDAANHSSGVKREAAIFGNNDFTHHPSLWVENGHRRAVRLQVHPDHTAADPLRTKARK